ncbi:MAG: GNAT family N-acetyltransferase [Gammaproteobacteria bacterium]|jgi:GNAT superfamily N-acetyltransferase
MTHSVTIKTVTGEALEQYITELARLRIEVFREYPYLYDGNMNYEAKYVRTYTESPHSIIVIAFDGDQVVGASTALPLIHETEEIRRPFLENHLDLNCVFYLGESVLRNHYRGQGIGVRFFKEREAHAKRIGDFSCYAFCAVERPVDHPLRPSDYVPLDRFWKNRGYRKQSHLRTTLSWLDIDKTTETAKPMVFWLKQVM